MRVRRTAGPGPAADTNGKFRGTAASYKHPHPDSRLVLHWKKKIPGNPEWRCAFEARYVIFFLQAGLEFIWQ